MKRQAIIIAFPRTALQAATEKVWAVRYYLRTGDVDPLAALTTLKSVAERAPPRLAILAAQTAAQITTTIVAGAQP